mmetsp:Transcript_45978/g.98043  ORF Transcript_45978/g.98043 Transcript_45978/m.98043 type:complete len:245 (-) Transcript_45978:124-858(-)
MEQRGRQERELAAWAIPLAGLGPLPRTLSCAVGAGGAEEDVADADVVAARLGGVRVLVVELEPVHVVPGRRHGEGVHRVGDGHDERVPGVYPPAACRRRHLELQPHDVVLLGVLEDVQHVRGVGDVDLHLDGDVGRDLAVPADDGAHVDRLQLQLAIGAELAQDAEAVRLDVEAGGAREEGHAGVGVDAHPGELPHRPATRALGERASAFPDERRERREVVEQQRARLDANRLLEGGPLDGAHV